MVTFACVLLVFSYVKAFKISLIYVEGCEKRKPKHILTDWMKINFEKLSFINLNRYPSIELTVEPLASVTFKPR